MRKSNIPTVIAAMVMYDGMVVRNVKNIGVRTMHDANFIATVEPSGDIVVWKDRFWEPGTVLSPAGLEDMITRHVRAINERSAPFEQLVLGL